MAVFAVGFQTVEVLADGTATVVSAELPLGQVGAIDGSPGCPPIWRAPQQRLFPPPPTWIDDFRNYIVGRDNFEGCRSVIGSEGG